MIEFLLILVGEGVQLHVQICLEGVLDAPQ